MSEDTLKQVKESQKIIEEARNTILKSIDVNDSYFYGNISFYRDTMSFDFVPKVKVRIVLKLFNSKDFDVVGITNMKRYVEPKQIVVTDEMSLEDYEMTNDESFIMQYFYEQLSRVLVKELLSNNSEEFQRVVIQNDPYYSKYPTPNLSSFKE